MTKLPPQIIELERLRRRCEGRREALARCDAYYERSPSSAEYERAREEILRGVNEAEASLREAVAGLHQAGAEELGRWVQAHRELIEMGYEAWGEGSLERQYARNYETSWEVVEQEGHLSHDLLYGADLLQRLPEKARKRYRALFGKP